MKTEPIPARFDDDRILHWFKGKARERAADALTAVRRSLAAGYWEPKASRSTWAAFNKANVAINLGRAHEGALDKLRGHSAPLGLRGFDVSMALCYPSARSIKAPINFDALHAQAPDDLKPVIESAREFCAAMRPLHEAMAQLDARRPPPVFTYLGVSPTVTALLQSLGLDAHADNIKPAPFETIQFQRVDGSWGWRQVLKWPADTRHGQSRYQEPHQCEACGHAIKNPFNWMPMLAHDGNGVPYSLWVGTDCAKNLFGIKVSGEWQQQRIVG